jgi:hypothetical protein
MGADGAIGPLDAFQMLAGCVLIVVDFGLQIQRHNGKPSSYAVIYA